MEFRFSWATESGSVDHSVLPEFAVNMTTRIKRGPQAAAGIRTVDVAADCRILADAIRKHPTPASVFMGVGRQQGEGH